MCKSCLFKRNVWVTELVIIIFQVTFLESIPLNHTESSLMINLTTDGDQWSSSTFTNWSFRNTNNESENIINEQNTANVPSISELTGPSYIRTGESVVLKCVVSNNPTPVFSWYKDGKLFVKDKTKYRINSRKRQSTLQINMTVVKDSGVYECVANNVVGESRKSMSLAVYNRWHGVPCEIQTYCLNGGICMHNTALSITVCKCPEMWAGLRCELLDGISMREDYNRQASLMMERTLVIVGIVIAVLVFIVICIASYILAKKGRKQYEQRRNRREANRAEQNRSATCVVNSNASQNTANKGLEIPNETSQLNPPVKPTQQIMLQDSSSPPDHHLPSGPLSEIPPHLQNSEVRNSSNGSKSERRSRLAASSVYENARNIQPSVLINNGDSSKHKETAVVNPSENIEMKVLPEINKTDQVTDKNHVPETWTEGIRSSTDPVDLPLSQSLPPFEPPSSLSLSTQPYLPETSPTSLESSLPTTQPLAPSLNSLSHDPPESFNNNVFSLNENDTAVQPLLPNHKNHVSVNKYAKSPRPFESKSDKDLSRYLPLTNKRQGRYDIHGYKNELEEHDHLLMSLSKLSHSNTFPKSKVNGVSLDTDTFSESDDDDDDEAIEVPYEKQLDLYISEEDLNLSKENSVGSSFSSVNTPSRQVSIEERGFGLRSYSGLSRPGIRKHQSEEGTAYKLVNRTHAILQDSARSRSLDNPPGRVDTSRDPKRLNSTVAGSPDVETYDNMAQQHPQLQNHTYSYDPNEDSAPWDGEMSRVHNHSSLTEEERDRQNRLKNVVPDQQAIPI